MSRPEREQVARESDGASHEQDGSAHSPARNSPRPDSRRGGCTPKGSVELRRRGETVGGCAGHRGSKGDRDGVGTVSRSVRTSGSG
jgi:hypothetical protein